MESTNYLALTGSLQGKIEGSCQHADHMGKIVILAYNHDVQVPTMMAIGQDDRKSSHSPIFIDKEIDQATPKLYQALFRNEKIESADFEWYRYEQNKAVLYFKVMLKNALVTQIKAHAVNNYDKNKEHQPFLERIGFVYEDITWSFGESGEVLYTEQWIGQE